jgi:hypothetical protein
MSHHPQRRASAFSALVATVPLLLSASARAFAPALPERVAGWLLQFLGYLSGRYLSDRDGAIDRIG